jgi:uncharacterized protein (DUF433 family)
MNWREYIVSDPAILAGKPVIKGTRLSVEFIVGRLANGWSESEVLENYQSLDKPSLQAVHAYTYDLLHDSLLYLPAETKAA